MVLYKIYRAGKCRIGRTSLTFLNLIILENCRNINNYVKYFYRMPKIKPRQSKSPTQKKGQVHKKARPTEREKVVSPTLGRALRLLLCWVHSRGGSSACVPAAQGLKAECLPLRRAPDGVENVQAHECAGGYAASYAFRKLSCTICIFMTPSPTLAKRRKKPLTEGSSRL